MNAETKVENPEAKLDENEIAEKEVSEKSEEKIKHRLNKSKEELSFSKKFDVVVVNDNFIVTKNKLVEIVNEFIKS